VYLKLQIILQVHNYTHNRGVSRELLLSQHIMVAPEVHHLFHNPIADHSFSADRSTLAVAKENNVELYQRSGNGFELQDELRGHDKLVTGVDIAPNSGKIVTCSQGTTIGIRITE
jgi:WD40 repeat protein